MVTSRYEPLEGSFPLTESALLWGVVLGGLAGGVCLSALAGFSVAVLVWLTGGLWRRDEPPVLSFCLGMQWVSAMTGVAYADVVGTYPGQPVVGDTAYAAWLSLVGFLCLGAGIRVSMLQYGPEKRARTTPPPVPRYDVRKLFWYVIAVYTASWFVEFNPRAILAAAEIVGNLMLTRLILLCFLVATVLRQREGYLRAALAFAYALLPVLASAMSNFKEFFFLIVLLLLAHWKPWLRRPDAVERTRRVTLMAVGLGIALLFMGLLWEGAIKPVWRPAAQSQATGSTPTERLATFMSVAGKAMETFDVGVATEALASRLSSGAAYFSLVLDRVPAVLPHEGGEMTQRAVLHVLQPRMFFPEKPMLMSDSWLIRTYTGLRAAGDEFATSIGLGYMAQLYIDFGAGGLLVALFVYGLYLGILYRLMRAWSPPGDLFGCAVAVLFVQHFITYDAEIAKQLGGLTQTFLILSALLHFAGPALLRRIATLARKADGGRPWGARLPTDRVTVGPRG